MARSWAQLLGEADGEPEPDERQAGMFSRLRDSLSKSRRALTEQIQAAAFDPGDDLVWERLEEALIQADVGVRATAELVQRLEARGELGDLGEALADEVEAALDDTNIGRFVELLRRYSDRAQFIVITHQKRTMEAADVLYGVTMGTDGVSQIVSRRLPREDEIAATA